jgi:enamine deaminase RidA (YjgF/YER057c/UK114 family)
VAGIEDRLAERGISLPAPLEAPPGVELPFELVRISGGHAYISGHVAMDGSNVLFQGKVGAEVTLEQAQEAARATGLSMLAALKQELGDLDRVVRWVKALGLVNCAPGFNQTPAVINGFTNLIIDLWGPDAGAHARSAIGVAELPFDAPVEIEAIVEVA